MVSIGQLSDVLDSKGTIAHIMRYQELYDKRYDIEMSIVLKDENSPDMFKDHIGFLIPSIAFFDKSLIESFKDSNLKLKKILIATTKYTVQYPTNHYEIGTSFVAERFGSALPTLKGLAQILPFSDAEKLLCDVHGILYE